MVSLRGAIPPWWHRQRSWNASQQDGQDAATLVNPFHILLATSIVVFSIVCCRQGKAQKSRGTPCIYSRPSRRPSQRPITTATPSDRAVLHVSRAATCGDPPVPAPCKLSLAAPVPSAVPAAQLLVAEGNPLAADAAVTQPAPSVFAHAHPPCTVHDTRPSLPDLYAKHAADICEVRRLVSIDPLYNASRHDDLWLLRFVLSHSKSGRKCAARAAEAARYTLAWREAHQVDQLSAELQRTPLLQHVDFERAHSKHVRAQRSALTARMRVIPKITTQRAEAEADLLCSLILSLPVPACL